MIFQPVRRNCILSSQHTTINENENNMKNQIQQSAHTPTGRARIVEKGTTQIISTLQSPSSTGTLQWKNNHNHNHKTNRNLGGIQSTRQLDLWQCISCSQGSQSLREPMCALRVCQQQREQVQPISPGASPTKFTLFLFPS